jgi:tetratricopeptide (TPR) repeat protein
MTALPAQPARRMAGPAKIRMAGVALALLVIAVYAGSLGGPFVYDDVPAIVENPTLRAPVGLRSLLLPPGDEAGTVGGRPVLNLSLGLNYQLAGPRPWSYHVTNVAIHVLAALLLFGVVRRTLDPRADRAPASAPQPGAGPSSRWRSPWTEPEALLMAFFSALLWALHPLQTEAVTYVVQRAESLMGFFYLLTLYCFVRSCEPATGGRNPGAIWAWLCVLACLLGMATKEVMVSAPLVVLLYDLAFVAGSLREAWRRRRGLYLALGGTWLLLGALVAGTHGRGGSAGFGSSAGVGPYLLTQGKAVVHYLRLAFWPAGLTFDYGTGLIRHPTEVIAPMIVLALLFAGAVWAWRRSRATGFLALVFFAVLAPSSSFVPIATEPMAEHRMYLPLAAVAILVVAAASVLASRWFPRSSRLAFCLWGGVTALALGTATVVRNRDYRSEIALWAATVSEAPENPRAHNNLAEAWRAAGDAAKAADEFAAAVRVDPDYTPAQYNLGVTLLDSGQTQAAIPHLEKALSAPRHQAELQLYLGEACERLSHPVEAAEHYRAALRLAPENAGAAFGLGNNLAAQSRFPEAVEAFEAAVGLAPDNARMRNNLANALLLVGRTDEAIEQYREAAKHDPANAQIQANLERAIEGNKPRRER